MQKYLKIFLRNLAGGIPRRGATIYPRSARVASLKRGRYIRKDGGCCVTRPFLFTLSPFLFLHLRRRKLQFPEAGRNAIKRWWLPKCKQLRKPIITGDNRSLLPPLSLSLSLSYLRRVLATLRGCCFTSQEWKLKGVGVSISRRLLIHDYRPPRYSLPECKMATSAGICLTFY